jgi:anti-sigma factor RsiW
MNLLKWPLGRSILLALSMTLSLTGCGAGKLEHRLDEATRRQAEAGQWSAMVDRLTSGEKPPADCDVEERSGVKRGDRQDVALRKTDAALYQANQRIRRCSKFNVAVNRGRP